MTENNYTANPETVRRVTNILRELGIPANLCGYHYLRTAICMVYDQQGMKMGLTGKLYPTLAVIYKTTENGVERAIRNSIEAAFDRGNTEKLESIFSYTISSEKGKPTNSEFIALIVDELRIEDGTAVA